MRIPRQVFTITGAAALLAAVALGGASFSLQADNDVHAVGEFTPSPDPTAPPVTPTTDPCVDLQPSGITAFGEQCTPTEETAPRTHTPTPEGTAEPTSPPATQPASTSTTAPPVATSTPSGGAGAGGLQPPSTGSNGDTGAADLGWLLLAAGLALAAGGTAALGYGLRKN